MSLLAQRFLIQPLLTFFFRCFKWFTLCHIGKQVSESEDSRAKWFHNQSLYIGIIKCSISCHIHYQQEEVWRAKKMTRHGKKYRVYPCPHPNISNKLLSHSYIYQYIYKGVLPVEESNSPCFLRVQCPMFHLHCWNFILQAYHVIGMGLGEKTASHIIYELCHPGKL